MLLGVCEDTYLKKEKRVVQWSSGPATSEVGAATVWNRTYRRFHAGGLWTTPLVQGGPAWSKVVQGGPLRGASSGAARGGASRGIKPQLARTVRLGIPRRSRRVSGAARLSGALSEQWTTSARGGPEGWSRVVQCGPVWSSGSRRRGVEGAQRSIRAWCAKDAQGDSASITASLRRIGWLGAKCSCVGRRPGCPFVIRAAPRWCHLAPRSSPGAAAGTSLPRLLLHRA